MTSDPRINPPPSTRPRDRLVVVLSDIEIGAGGVTDDFPQSAALADYLQRYNEPPWRDIAVDLVLNGDTFDFLKVDVDGAYPRHITAEVALAKLSRVHAAHGAFFDGLRAFAEHSSAPRRIYFIVGNHDPELLFVAVQSRIKALIGGRVDAHFPGFSVAIGDLWIEHGSQADPLFAMNPHRLFGSHHGRRILNLPFGTVGIIDVALPMHPELHFLDRLRPREAVMERLPAFRELILGRYRRYWTRDFWRDFAADPTRHVSWTMLKEIAYRFVSEDPDVSVAQAYRTQLSTDGRYKVRCVGHEHCPGWWSYGNRRLVRTGAFRNEFMMHGDAEELDHIRPVHAEILLRDGRVHRSRLVEVDPMPPPAGYVPESLESLLPAIHALLAEDDPSALEDLREAEAKARIKSA